MGRARRQGSRAYYASQFRQVFGRSLERRLARTGSPGSASSSRRTSTRSAAIRRRRTSDLSRAGARLGLARVLRRRAPASSTPRSTIPGVVAHVGAISLDDRRRARSSSTSRARVIYTVTSLAYDPGSAHALLHHRQQRATATSCAVDPTTGKTDAADRRTRASATSRSTAPTSRSGGSGTSTASATLVRIPPPYREWDRVHVVARTATVVYDLDVSPDGTLVVGLVRRDRRQAERCACSRTESCSRGDATPVAQFDFGSLGPVGLRLLARRPPPATAARTTPASSNIFRYDLATREARAP